MLSHAIERDLTTVGAVCLSVHPSVTSWYHVKTNDHWITRFCHRVAKDPSFLYLGARGTLLRWPQTRRGNTGVKTGSKDGEYGVKTGKYEDFLSINSYISEARTNGTNFDDLEWSWMTVTHHLTPYSFFFRSSLCSIEWTVGGKKMALGLA